MDQITLNERLGNHLNQDIINVSTYIEHRQIMAVKSFITLSTELHQRLHPHRR
jgi:hypothetical protein